MISVIMPIYNNINYISESIESVLNQSYSQWELIIIDDGSDIDIVPTIRIYLKDKRIKYFKLEKNSGVAAARNKGVALAVGQYIAFLDSDDIWLPDKLKKQLKFMQGKQAAISCTQYRNFSDNVNKPGKLINIADKLDYKELLKGNRLGCLTVMIDRQYIANLEMPSMRHEDYITWLNIAKAGFNIYCLKEDLARYRVSNNSISSNKWKSLYWTWLVYRKSQGLSVLKSINCFIQYVYWGISKRM